MTEEEDINKANEDRKESWVRRIPFYGFVFAGLGFFVVLTLLTLAIEGLIPPPTREQIIAQDAARQKIKEEEDNKRYQTELKREFCHLRSVCPTFAKVRQECATAGNYKLCVSIKMGDDAALVDACSNDGKIAYIPPGFPDAVRCFFGNY